MPTCAPAAGDTPDIDGGTVKFSAADAYTYDDPGEIAVPIGGFASAASVLQLFVYNVRTSSERCNKRMKSVYHI